MVNSNAKWARRYIRLRSISVRRLIRGSSEYFHRRLGGVRGVIIIIIYLFYFYVKMNNINIFDTIFLFDNC